jgi:uncharacterized glyoxalase superfamily protein PhnB
MATAKPIPDGMHTVTPNLVIRAPQCAKAIEFYRSALGAQEISRFPSPDGKTVWHAELRIGDSAVFVNDEMPGAGRPAPTADAPVPVTMWLYVPDCDAAFQRAVRAGAKETMAPEDMFWGDRCAAVVDPFGYQWSFATHQKDLSMEEMRRAGEEFARSMQERMGQGGQPHSQR